MVPRRVVRVSWSGHVRHLQTLLLESAHGPPRCPPRVTHSKRDPPPQPATPAWPCVPDPEVNLSTALVHTTRKHKLECPPLKTPCMTLTPRPPRPFALHAPYTAPTTSSGNACPFHPAHHIFLPCMTLTSRPPPPPPLCDALPTQTNGRPALNHLY